MATSFLLRSVHGSSAVVIRPQIFRCGVPIVHKKSLQLSAAVLGRVYGPPEAGGKDGAAVTKHFKAEKILAASLIPIIPTAIIFPNMAFDTILTASVVLHTHWGFTAACNDYIHGNTLPKVIKSSVLLLSILAFGSLCHLNYFDCGLGNAIRMVFSQL